MPGCESFYRAAIKQNNSICVSSYYELKTKFVHIAHCNQMVGTEKRIRKIREEKMFGDMQGKLSYTLRLCF